MFRLRLLVALHVLALFCVAILAVGLGVVAPLYLVFVLGRENPNALMAGVACFFGAVGIWVLWARLFGKRGHVSDLGGDDDGRHESGE